MFEVVAFLFVFSCGVCTTLLCVKHIKASKTPISIVKEKCSIFEEYDEAEILIDEYLDIVDNRSVDTMERVKLRDLVVQKMRTNRAIRMQQSEGAVKDLERA